MPDPLEEGDVSIIIWPEVHSRAARRGVQIPPEPRGIARGGILGEDPANVRAAVPILGAGKGKIIIRLAILRGVYIRRPFPDLEREITRGGCRVAGTTPSVWG